MSGNHGRGVVQIDSGYSRDSLVLTNCTIAGNRRSGIEYRRTEEISSEDRDRLELTNCIVRDNAEGSLSLSPELELAVSHSCIEGMDAIPESLPKF